MKASLLWLKWTWGTRCPPLPSPAPMQPQEKIQAWDTANPGRQHCSDPFQFYNATHSRGQHEKARIISQTLLKHRITYDSSDTTQRNTKRYSKLSSSQRGYTLPNASMGNAELQLQDCRGPGSGGTEERESTFGTQHSKGYQMLHFHICLRFLLCKMGVVAATS